MAPSVQKELLAALEACDTLPTTDTGTPPPTRLHSAIENWLQNGQQSYCIYALSYMCGHGSVSLKKLAETDSTIKRVRALPGDLGVDIFLTELVKEETGDCDPAREHSKNFGMYHAEETNYRLNSIVDLDGRMVSKGMTLDYPDLLDDCVFDDMDYDDAAYERGQGKYDDARATLFYRYPAIILVPRRGTAEFLLSSSDDTENLPFIISFLADKALDQGSDVASLDTIKGLCKRAWEEDQLASFSNGPGKLRIDSKTAAKVLQLAVQFEDWTFFEELSGRLHSPYSLNFYLWLGQHLQSTGVLVKPMAEGHDLGIGKLASLNDKLWVVSHVIPRGEEVPGLQQWSQQTLSAVLISAEDLVLGSQDGHVLARMPNRFDAKLRSESVVPLVRNRAKDVAFLLGFLTMMEKHIANPESSPWPEAAAVYRDLAGLVGANLDLANGQSFQRIFTTSKAARDSCFDILGGSQMDCVKCALDTGDLCVFAKSLIILELPDALESFNDKIASDAALIPAIEFHDLWLPVVYKLIAIQVEDLKMDLATAPYFRGCRALVLAYIDNYVGREPEEEMGSTVGAAFRSLARRERSPRQEWRVRAAQATQALSQFQQDQLRILLGDQYESMTKFEHLKLATRGSATANQASPSATETRTLAAASGNTGLVVPEKGQGNSKLGATGVKRKVSEVVDLTGDEPTRNVFRKP